MSSPLTDRLDALRQAAGRVGSPAPAATRGPGLAEVERRLARLPRLRRASPGSPRPPSGEAALAERLGGRTLARGLLCITTDLPRGARHGDRTIEPPSPASLSRFGCEQAKGAQMLALDVETTGLSSGAGTVAFLVGLARFTPRALQVEQLLLTRFEGESALLGELRQRVEPGDVVLSYNGRTYDVPLLAGRFRLHRVESPLEALPHLDLLHPVRRTFKGTWSDCRLASVERALLGVRRMGDIHGAEVPSAWFRWLREARGDDLERVLAHNRHDLASVALLPDALAEAQLRPSPWGADGAAGAHEHLRGGDVAAALAHLLANEDTLDARGRHLLATVARRSGRPETALRVWQALSEDDDALALEQLAKHREHVGKDYRSALALTERLLAAEHDPRHEHRRTRLLVKLARVERTARDAALPELSRGGTPGERR